MTDLLRAWLMSLAGTALVCAAALRLTPEGRTKGVVRFLCGVCMAAALFAPLRRVAIESYPLALARYRQAARAVTDKAEDTRRALDRAYIEREMEAYILDKARALGLGEIEAHVALRWHTAGVWLPEAVTLSCPRSAILGRWMEAELGIPETMQHWRSDEGP